jgi:deazaflavin-dependent oxidoreductase (nitroreductase family)
MRAQGLVNLLVRGLLRTPVVSRGIGRRLVTLHVVGRTSGRTYVLPVAYLADGDDLLVGTSFGWARNLRTGEPMTVRLRGRLRSADVEVVTAEPDVVAAYARMAAENPAFARFNRLRVDPGGRADVDDLHAAWLGGARVIRLTPR